MLIHYYGHSCFKITTKPAGRGQEDVTLFIDPFDKATGLRPPQGSADFVLVSHHHHDHDNVEAIKGDPRVIDIPGEYSVKGVNIIGLNSLHSDQGDDRGPNTIYIIDSEDIRLTHLGDLGTDLNEKQLETINGVDILMIPIGGKYTIDYKKALELIKKIEPKIAIPIHYRMGNTITDIDDEKKFCSEAANCSTNRVSKMNIKKKDLEGKSMETVVMSID